jgi:hypothetical protein
LKLVDQVEALLKTLGLGASLQQQFKEQPDDSAFEALSRILKSKIAEQRAVREAEEAKGIFRDLDGNLVTPDRIAVGERAASDEVVVPAAPAAKPPVPVAAAAPNVVPIRKVAPPAEAAEPSTTQKYLDWIAGGSPGASSCDMSPPPGWSTRLW